MWSREEVATVAREVGKDVLITIEAQELARTFHRQNLGVGPFWCGSALPEAGHVQPLPGNFKFVVNAIRGYNQGVRSMILRAVLSFSN